MTRVAIAEIKQETATFNPAPTRYEAFQTHFGEEMLTALRGTRTEVAGALDTLDAAGGVDILPGLAAWSVSGGRIPTADLDRLTNEFVDSILQHADRADGVYLCMHGAMAGETEGDPEGRALERIRQGMGSKPIVVSLDLHAVISARLVRDADVIVPYHTYPHVDQYETGQRAANCLIGLLRGGWRPTTARVELPMLVRGDELLTDSGRFGEAIRMCQEVEVSPEGIAAGVIIGNAFTDVPDLQSNVLVTTNNAPDLARQKAERIGRFMWEHRREFVAELTPLAEAIALASETDGLTIFSDAADATASGASGDSNAILRGLIEAQFERSAVIPIVDAPAAAAAHAAGVGADITVTLGGTLDPGRFQPLQASVRVEALMDGSFGYENGTRGDGGATAVLRLGTLKILVVSRPVFFVGQQVYQEHGLDPREFDLVVVKSPNGFRPYFESIAARIVPVDVPGSTSANLLSLPFAHCVRPIFPLDSNVPSPFEEDAS